jgi:deoxyribodipyrimidine photolyase-related protein
VQTVLILGDQLNRESSALDGCTPGDTRILFITATGLIAGKRWHRQRLHLVMSGMAKLAESFRADGFVVDERTAPSITEGIALHRTEFAPTEIRAMSPMSYNAVQMLQRAGVTLTPNIQFLCDAQSFADWAGTRKSRLRMEDFYR